MTSNDKTGDKLVASIRKTKASATKETGATQSAPSTPRRRAAAKSKPAAEKPATPSTTQRQSPAGDSYQAARRIWPD